MKISFAVNLGASYLTRKDLPKFIDTAKMCDAAGVDMIGVSDTAFAHIDAFVKATIIAQVVERAAVGPRPTNPITREPQIMAAALAGLDGISDGKAFCNIASGDSAVLNIGRKPATLAQFEEYITCVRDLIGKGTGTYQGRPQRVRWESFAVRRRIPFYIVAEGPKTLHMAGRIGDGVMPGNGLTADVVKDTISRIHAGARDGGRKPEDVEIWFSIRPALLEDREKAVEQVLGSVASALNHSSRFGLEGKHHPPELHRKLEKYVAGYDLYDHARGRNVLRLKEAGLMDYALRRYAIAGTPSDWIKRIEELADAGATRIWTSTFQAGELDGQMHSFRLLCEKVIPHFV